MSFDPAPCNRHSDPRLGPLGGQRGGEVPSQRDCKNILRNIGRRLMASAGGVMVGSYDGGVDRHPPGVLADIAAAMQLLEHPSPGAVR